MAPNAAVLNVLAPVMSSHGCKELRTPACLYIAVVLAHQRQREEEGEFEVVLDSRVSYRRPAQLCSGAY